jgi:mevalonate kinase
LGKPWDKTLINQTAYEVEKKQHGRPSGGDNSIVCFGGFLRFQKKEGGFIIKPIKIERQLPEFVLLDSGRAKETTGEMVGLVGEKYKRQKAKTAKILDSLGKVTEGFVASFKKREFIRLADIIKENERLLEELGVVGERTKNLIRRIEKRGGAAKICGAGGLKKGSGVMLCYHQDPRVILNFAKNQGLTCCL